MQQGGWQLQLQPGHLSANLSNYAHSMHDTSPNRMCTADASEARPHSPVKEGTSVNPNSCDSSAASSALEVSHHSGAAREEDEDTSAWHSTLVWLCFLLRSLLQPLPGLSLHTRPTLSLHTWADDPVVLVHRY